LTIPANRDETLVRPKPGRDSRNNQNKKLNMAGTPLRWNMTLPNGQPLCWDTPGARWDGTVEEVMAAIEQQNNNTTMSKNLISAALAAQAVTNITTAVATSRTNLPFILNLTPDQRKSLPSITEASHGIVLATINFVAQHPEALSATFNITEFNKDAALLAPLQQVASLIATLNTDTDDTLRALHGDLYSEFLDVYALAKAGNRSGAYDDYLNSVKGRFSKGPSPAAKAAKAAAKAAKTP
jgi:hypothetical protein